MEQKEFKVERQECQSLAQQGSPAHRTMKRPKWAKGLFMVFIGTAGFIHTSHAGDIPEAITDANLKLADWITKDMRVNGKPIPSVYEQHRRTDPHHRQEDMESDLCKFWKIQEPSDRQREKIREWCR